MVTDFDGTVTLKDVSDALLLHFKAAGRSEIARSYDPSVALERWMTAYYRLLKVPRRRIEEYVREAARLRGGFPEFSAFCKGSGIPLEIVSGGLDVYIDCLLRYWRLKINAYRARARFTPEGIRIDYPFLRNTSLDDFKARRVCHYQKKGYEVLFCGDGTSDLKAARLADAVFATKRLRIFCGKEEIRHRQLKNFFDVKSFLVKNRTGR